MRPPIPCEIVIDYTNWKGERRERRVRPIELWYGSTEHHPEAQWFMQALDIEKDDYRDFALKDIHSVR
jgi:predicted DNA-binding transcriptional regulator YafY